MRVYKHNRAGGGLDFPYERSEWSNLGRKTDNSMALVFLMLVHYKYNVEPRSWNQSESTVGVFFFVLSCVEFGLASLYNLGLRVKLLLSSTSIAVKASSIV